MLHQPLIARELSHSAPPRVYSYSRFSTPEQQEGDSLRRQTDGAHRWMSRKNAERAAHGLLPLVFDERLNLSDLGVSAFRGGNTAEDRGLGGFLSACRQGLIAPGSYLVVESLDRVSRMTPRKVSHIVNEIVDAGVIIATLSDGQEYDAERMDNDPTALLISLMVSWRAHEESKMKAVRLSEVWAEKRRRVRAGIDRRLTRKGPSWLQPDGDGWQERQPHADTVRRIYRLTLDGMGEHKIAHQLNAEAVPLMGRGAMWHRSTVSKVLRNPAVIGTLVPGRMDYSDGKPSRKLEEPIAGALPAAVTLADWEAVRALKDGKAPAVRGRGAGGSLSNLFAGLARCPECGAAMTRVMKGSGPKGGKPKLVCVRAKAGLADHPYHSVTLDDLHCTFADKWQELLIDIPAGAAGGDTDGEVANLQALLDVTVGEIEDLLATERRRPSLATTARRRGLEATLASYRGDLKAMEHERALADHGLIASRAESLADIMEGSAALEIGKANALLRTLLAGVVVDYRTGTLSFCWRQGGSTSLSYTWV